MYLRTVYATGDPARIDQVLDTIRAEAPRMLASQPGYRGYGLFADRELGKIAMGSWWETEADRENSDAQLKDRRAALLAPFAGTVTTDVWEAVVFTPPAHAGPGAGFRMVRVDVDPAGADRMVTAFRDGVLPKLQQVPGFGSATLLLDRASGRASVGVLFADKASMVASRGPHAAIRGEGTKAAGVVLRSLEEFEVVLLDRPGT
ncbi:antibiotic biosynthesis monooxygenase [Kitasatospora sp. NPDC059571]|uniref:antibiotic biosynthesis monooxygenase n=1 Tax=Kitasatospora sp. NPDC059571 TaxID=3346871 RepID=UPI00368DB974